jgi:hypothetical protein
MVNRKSVFTACGAAMVALAMAASGHARQDPSRTNYLTFSAPVALPGVTLGSGTYIFERADPNVLDIVQVLSRDRSRVYFMAFTRQIQRPAGMSADRLVSLGEAPAGVPAPIRAWYPRGESRGHQFIYAKDAR